MTPPYHPNIVTIKGMTAETVGLYRHVPSLVRPIPVYVTPFPVEDYVPNDE